MGSGELFRRKELSPSSVVNPEDLKEDDGEDAEGTLKW